VLFALRLKEILLSETAVFTIEEAVFKYLEECEYSAGIRAIKDRWVTVHAE